MYVGIKYYVLWTQYLGLRYFISTQPLYDITIGRDPYQRIIRYWYTIKLVYGVILIQSFTCSYSVNLYDDEYLVVQSPGWMYIVNLWVALPVISITE